MSKDAQHFETDTFVSHFLSCSALQEYCRCLVEYALDESNWGSYFIIPAALAQVIPSIRLLLSSSKSESATDEPDEPPAKKRKRGRKSHTSQDAYDDLLRDLAIMWAYDTEGRSPEAFCKDKGSSHMASSLRRLIYDKNLTELKQAAQRGARNNPDIVDAAIEAIEQHFKKVGTTNTQDGLPLVQHVERSRQETNTILNYKR